MFSDWFIKIIERVLMFINNDVINLNKKFLNKNKQLKREKQYISRKLLTKDVNFFSFIINSNIRTTLCHQLNE